MSVNLADIFEVLQRVDHANPANWGHPLMRGLVGYWPTLLGTGNKLRGFGPLAGDAIGHNGVAIGNDPLLGRAAQNFDYTENKRYWSAPLKWPGGPISLATWLYAPSSGTANGRSFFSNSSATWPDVFHGQIQPSSGTNCLFWDYGTYPDGRLAAEPLFDEWMHLVLVSAADAEDAYMAIYINGVLAAEKFESYDLGSFSGIDIGRLNATNLGDEYYHLGGIADFRIYNRVLSPAEAWQLYAPQTRWAMLNLLPEAEDVGFSWTPTAPTSGFRLINGRHYRPGRLIA